MSGQIKINHKQENIYLGQNFMKWKILGFFCPLRLFIFKSYRAHSVLWASSQFWCSSTNHQWQYTFWEPESLVFLKRSVVGSVVPFCLMIIKMTIGKHFPRAKKMDALYIHYFFPRKKGTKINASKYLLYFFRRKKYFKGGTAHAWNNMQYFGTTRKIFRPNSQNIHLLKGFAYRSSTSWWEPAKLVLGFLIGSTTWWGGGLLWITSTYT